MSEPERALVGIEDIAAWLETLWRQRRHRRRRVTRRMVRHWIKSLDLPAERFGDGPWEASQGDITAWWERNFSDGTRSDPHNLSPPDR